MWHRKTYLSDGGGSRASLAGSYDGTLDQASYQSSLPPGVGGRGHSPVINAIGLRALHQASSYPSLHTLQVGRGCAGRDSAQCLQHGSSGALLPMCWTP